MELEKVFLETDFELRILNLCAKTWEQDKFGKLQGVIKMSCKHKRTLFIFKELIFAQCLRIDLLFVWVGPLLVCFPRGTWGLLPAWDWPLCCSEPCTRDQTGSLTCKVCTKPWVTSLTAHSFVPETKPRISILVWWVRNPIVRKKSEQSQYAWK